MFISLIAGEITPAASQEDSVTIVPGAHYDAGRLKRLVLGREYRDLWTMPIKVPVLRPDTFAGGLTLLQPGGGRQTRSLRFAGADGTEYVFRSVDKDQSGGLHEDIQDVLVDDIIQDQISSKHPAAAVVVAPLMEAAGVLHVTPRLVVMADHPVLGEFRSEFAGMLGLIEERPEEQEGGPNFGGFERVIGTDRLLERLEESAEDRPVATAYLAARLMDLLLGDWDRHNDQWRWAQIDSAGRRYWLPIPRDRDNAFFHADGLIGFLGRSVRPFVISFDAEYPDLYDLSYTGRELDRRILPEVPRAEWDSIALDLQARLTNEVISNAVRRLPPEYYAASGAQLEARLKARRDLLPEFATSFYDFLITAADIRATDDADVASIRRQADGSVRVTLTEAEATTPYFDRTFDERDTREVRVYLHGGADRAVVEGEGAEGMIVRVLGGGGDDRLEDTTGARSGANLFYDDRGENTFLPGHHTRIDERGYEPMATDTLTVNNEPPARDWGARSTSFDPEIQWRSDIGPVLGGGPEWTHYGFRREPYAVRTSLDALYAPVHNRFEVAVERRQIRTGGRTKSRLRASASQISLTRFHGFGNETPDGSDSSLNRVWSTEFTASGELRRALTTHWTGWAGPTVAYLDPEPRSGSPAEIFSPPGSSSFGVGGLRAGMIYDRRDSEDYPRRGVKFSTVVDGYPLVWGDAPEAFARGSVTGMGYLPLPLPLEATLALRAGGAHVVGDAPFQYGAFLGGGSSLRGHRTERYVGDSSVFGTAELRNRLARLNLLIARAEVGTILLYDIGRVYLDGEESDDWHTAWGAGLWFGTIERSYTGRLLYIQGERITVSAGIGVPF